MPRSTLTVEKAQVLHQLSAAKLALVQLEAGMKDQLEKRDKAKAEIKRLQGQLGVGRRQRKGATV